MRAPLCTSRPAGVFSAIGLTRSAMPKIASSVSMSIARSTTMVASAIDLESFSRRASAHGRTNSPRRNGSTLFAMKPIMVALNRLPLAIGRSTCSSSRQRIARTQNAKIVIAMTAANPR